jgi:hypothetical protein
MCRATWSVLGHTAFWGAAVLALPLAHEAAAEQATGVAQVAPGTAPGVKLMPNAATKPGATGLSLAGAKVFSTPKEAYLISDKNAGSRMPGPPGGTANELSMMQFVVPLVEALVPLAAPPATAAQKAAAEAAFAAGALSAFKQTDPVPPATVGDFTRIGKGALNSGLATVNNNGLGVELATARAKQDATKNPLDTTGTGAGAFVGATPQLPNPKAAAYAVNIDPTAVEWNSLGNRSVSLDLTGIQLQAKTTGQGSLAAATDNFIGAVRDGTTDVTLPQDGATDLFKLSLGVFDAGDAPATDVTTLSFLGLTSNDDPGGLQISDSEGGVGLTEVTDDLAASFLALGGGLFQIVNDIDPADPFTISMTVPGGAPSSVLYFDELQGAGTQAVPEGSTATLLAGALLPLGFLRSRRSRRGSLASANRLTGRKDPR